MKLSAIVFILALASGSAVFAAECSDEEIESTSPYDSKSIAACGLDYEGLQLLPRWAVDVYCKKTSCLEAMGSIADDAPDCNVGPIYVPGMFRGMSTYCKTVPNSTDSSSVGKLECSLSEKAKVIELRIDPVMTKLCGLLNSAGASKKICDSNCRAYIKEKFIPALPNCTVDGADAMTATMTTCGTSGTPTIVSAVALVGAFLVTLGLV